MRPQHITAENVRMEPPPGRGPGGFNEAAAYHCGKREYRYLSPTFLAALQ